MERYAVRITDRALSDMEGIYDYIAVDLLSPENAMGQYDRIANSIMRLKILPQRYAELEAVKGLRRMPVDNFSVFFRIDDMTVTVTNVLYSASNISNRLK